MKTTIYANEKEKEMGLSEGRLWKTMGDFAKAHDMIMANWLSNSEYWEKLVDSHNDYDEERDYTYDIFQWFIVDRDTIEDIEYFDIDIPYFEYNFDDYEVYAIGITHFGMPWDMVNLGYFTENEEEDEENEE